MKISIISFTAQGELLAKRVRENMSDYDIRICRSPDGGITKWAGEQFSLGAALLFIGACGIAVRAISPFVRDKLSDSPVLVMDEQARFVIPVLSGHIGGANELARLIEKRIGATAVITTATDLQGKFAVDLFAQKNGFQIQNRDGIAKVSSKILRGENIKVSIPCEADGNNPPDGIKLVSCYGNEAIDVLVSDEMTMAASVSLWLRPKEYVIGIGCKKGKSKPEIDSFIRKILMGLKIEPVDIWKVTSIDRKKEEIGIREWAENHKIPFFTFSAETLRRFMGDFSSSAFVEETVGVDNVCERAAIAGCDGKGELICHKQEENGITLAIAKRRIRIEW